VENNKYINLVLRRFDTLKTARGVPVWEADCL